jgi:hypothetical protein
MENESEKNETEIDRLARMVQNGFAEMRGEFAGLLGETLAGFAAVNNQVDGIQERLGYRIGELGSKLDEQRRESSEGFDAIRRVVSGVSRTVADHEERIKAVEGD